MARTFPSATIHAERSVRRQRVLLGGKLVFGVAEFNVDCTIRDLSDAGARVKLPMDLPTPPGQVAGTRDAGSPAVIAKACVVGGEMEVALSAALP